MARGGGRAGGQGAVPHPSSLPPPHLYCTNHSQGPKVDCGFVGITQAACEAKECCWHPVPAPAGRPSTEPWCFAANAGASDYEVVVGPSPTPGGAAATATLAQVTATLPELGPDVRELAVTLDAACADVARLTLAPANSSRWRVADVAWLFAGGLDPGPCPESARRYDVEVARRPFGVRVVRCGKAIVGSRSSSPRC